MYDHHPSSLILHRTASTTALSDNASSNPPNNATNSQSSSSSSNTSTTRPMRAGSCSSATTSSHVADSTMTVTSPHYDAEDPTGSGTIQGSSSAASRTMTIFDCRKRKCEEMEPRTPLPTISSPAHLYTQFTPRPRSATCSGSGSGPSSSSTSTLSRARHQSSLLQQQYQNQHRLRTTSISTATRSDAGHAHQGTTPMTSSNSKLISATTSSSTLLTWKRQKRPGLPTFQNDAPSSSTSTSLQPQSNSGTMRDVSKRPRLESVASTGHLHVQSGTTSTYSSSHANQHDTHLEVDTQHGADDVPSAPPSASFSNLTITQPPSPAYAAFSQHTPPPPPGLPSPNSPSQFAFAQAKAQQAELEARQDEVSVSHEHVLQISPPSAPSATDVDASKCQARQSRTSSSRPVASSRRGRDKRPSGRLTTRRRLKRATSLPLEDEITLARSQMMQHRQQHRRTTSTMSTTSVTSSSSTPALAGAIQTVSDSIEEADIHMRGGDHTSVTKDEVPTLIERRQSLNTPTGAQSSEGSSPVKSEQAPTDADDALLSSSTAPQEQKRSARAYRQTTLERTTVQVQVPPVLVTPAQLSAMHQFNMPKAAPLAPLPPTLGSRASFPPFPSRTQAFPQPQRRLPIPIIHPQVAPVPDASFGGTYRPNLAYAPLLPPAVSLPSVPSSQGTLQEQKKTQPTASIPGYTPPIAKETLKELDLQEVLQCRQLRHDVVFDANLMFRPNFDGDRGDRKREAADRYWAAITRELETGCKCTAYSFAPSATARMMGRPSVPLPCICRGPSMPFVRTSVSERLPSRIVPLIQELRDILLALLPQPGNEGADPNSPTRRNGGSATAQMIRDTLDPALIAQEVSHGVLDLASLATFFGHILKSHCAPMRDEVVEVMIRSIRHGGAHNNMSMVSNGLRMCFEILELMKLDIANHQLRMLRPYLVETAADFEYKTFMHLREKKPQSQTLTTNTVTTPSGPPMSKTNAWMVGIRERRQLTATASPVDACSSVVDGVLELLFKPSGEVPEASIAEKIQPARHPAAVERRKAPRTQALPLITEVPETFQLDTYRLQLFHGDVVDLCVVHLLILLYRQLCSINKRRPTAEDVEIIRRQIWVIMSDVNTAAAASPSGNGRRTTPSLPQSIKKLESEQWREGMKDVLLQISRYSTATMKSDNLHALEAMFVPDSATLSLLNRWMDNNFKSDSNLFLLVQSRLRKALSGLIYQEIQQHNRSVIGKTWDMASVELAPESRPEADAIIQQTGLTDLAGEVRLLASRISKVVGYNAHVFRDLYTELLNGPSA